MLEMKGKKAPMSNPQFVLVHGADGDGEFIKCRYLY